MIVGTAGHVDHGKTLLVQALTGVDTDRLPEEKARGMSIELGYAYLEGPGDPGAVGFVDVPGHERFVSHMLAGASGIDFVLLVVALDDGVMPQTREHLEILKLLAARGGAVVLTKRDRVEPARIEAVMAQLDALLAGSFLAACPRFAVSSRTGQGIAELKSFLLRTAASWPERSARQGLRLAIDRCFTLHGVGTVVAGMVHAGRVQVGDRLVLSPGSQRVRVRSLHVHAAKAESGHAGQRCALNIAGAGLEKDAVHRGQWLLAPELEGPTSDLDIALALLPGAPPVRRGGVAVHLHIATEHLLAQLQLLESQGDGRFLAQLRLPRPIGAVHGDRLIVRDASGAQTLGGGRVLDPFPPRRGRRTPARLAWLRALEHGGPVAALGELRQAHPHGLALAQWRRMGNLAADDAQAAIAHAGVRPVPGPLGELLFSGTDWQDAGEAVLQALGAAHAHSPGHAGLPIADLRRQIRPRWDVITFEHLLQSLRVQSRLARTGPAWHLPGHRVRLSAGDEQLWRQIEPLLGAKAFAPPRVDQLARELAIDEASARATLERVAQTGAVWRVDETRYYLRPAIAELAAILWRMTHGEDGTQRPVTAALLRDEIHIGRNLVIALLEFFDRCGCTRRVGNAHWPCGEHLLSLEGGPAAASESEQLEGHRPRWGGRSSKPDGAALQARVGSTPISFRHNLEPPR